MDQLKEATQNCDLLIKKKALEKYEKEKLVITKKIKQINRDICSYYLIGEMEQYNKEINQLIKAQDFLDYLKDRNEWEMLNGLKS